MEQHNVRTSSGVLVGRIRPRPGGVRPDHRVGVDRLDLGHAALPQLDRERIQDRQQYAEHRTVDSVQLTDRPAVLWPARRSFGASALGPESIGS